MELDGKDEVDDAGEDEEAIGVDKRVEEDELGLMNDDGCRLRRGGDRNKEQFRKSGHRWWCEVKSWLQSA